MPMEFVAIVAWPDTIRDAPAPATISETVLDGPGAQTIPVLDGPGAQTILECQKPKRPYQPHTRRRKMKHGACVCVCGCVWVCVGVCVGGSK